jgi:hypothetical protein
VNLRRFFIITCSCALLSGCSFQNRYEREAESITRAVMANNLAPVENDIAPGINVTRVQVAAWADELDDQGKLLSLKEVTPCAPGFHCFDVKFQKHEYVERMALDDHGKVTNWTFHMKRRDAVNAAT